MKKIALGFACLAIPAAARQPVPPLSPAPRVSAGERALDIPIDVDWGNLLPRRKGFPFHAGPLRMAGLPAQARATGRDAS